MAIFGKSNNTEVIGLDIGSHAIKAVQLEHEREGLAVKKAGSRPTPPEAVKAGVIVEPAAVAAEVSALLDALEVEATAACVACAGPTVVVRQLQLPTVSERQLRQSLQWEARNYISFPVEESTIEFQVLARNGAQMEVMMVAAPRELVEGQLETLSLAGLEAVAVEIQPFSAIRALVEWSADGALDEETVALMGLGAAYTDINIVRGRSFVLTRMIPIAGDSMTEAIASALSMEKPKAEALKETAMQVVSSEEERATLDPFAQQASRAVEPLLDELIREVRRSLAYYDYQQQAPAQQAATPGVNRIIISGGTSKMAGLAKYLQSQLGVPVEMAELFGGSRLPAPGLSQEYLDEHAPGLVVATGLALREILLANKSLAKVGVPA
jgi:type IV pilus assembly protein PilM